jgi:hypothetical protein
MKNQCDGCRRGLKLKDGIHVDANNHPVMACTKPLYIVGIRHCVGFEGPLRGPKPPKQSPDFEGPLRGPPLRDYDGFLVPHSGAKPKGWNSR